MEQKERRDFFGRIRKLPFHVLHLAKYRDLKEGGTQERGLNPYTKRAGASRQRTHTPSIFIHHGGSIPPQKFEWYVARTSHIRPRQKENIFRRLGLPMQKDEAERTNPITPEEFSQALEDLSKDTKDPLTRGEVFLLKRMFFG